MAYESKKALLISMGKNPDDRNLVKRMIERWEVYVEWGMYYLVKEENGEKLNSQNFSDAAKILELKWEIEKLKEENHALKVANKKLSEWVPGEDLYYHLKFFYERFLNWKRFVDGKVFGQSQYNNQQWKQDTMEMVQPEVYARYNFVYWDVEKSECEFVEQLINERVEKWMELPF